jgi:NAD(P) transhydrogenase subunit alpha
MWSCPHGFPRTPLGEVTLIVAVPTESYPNERRVAVIPAVVPDLTRAGLEVLIEPGAGARAGFADNEYTERGARLASDRASLFSSADVLAVMHRPGAGGQEGDLAALREGQVVVGLLNPLGDAEGVRTLAGRGVTAFALELLPRISRAQPMDALTMMATVAGYKAVLLAADRLPKMFPLMMTAAGTVTPARVLVVGAGVAGLQAIATARRLGAVVHAYDVRPAVKEQVESLGAKFLELALDTQAAEGTGGYAQEMGEEFYARQREMMGRAVAECDVVITTAAVPGKKAPLLVTADMVRGMRPGSLVVDLAAETGGNCELTRAGETVEEGGVTILGPVQLAAEVPYHASQLYARTVSAFLKHLVRGGELNLNVDDEILRDTLVCRGGEVVHPRVREALGLAGEPATQAKE